MLADCAIMQNGLNNSATGKHASAQCTFLWQHIESHTAQQHLAVVAALPGCLIGGQQMGLNNLPSDAHTTPVNL